jgi:purine-nucleoside phosphorylase
MNTFLMDHYEEATEFIKSKITKKPVIAIVLGSGLSSLVDDINNKTIIKYNQIPYFPESTVASHAGEMVIGDINGTDVLIMSGRFHYYEGRSFSQTAFYIRVLHLLGIKSIILTNAAGGINIDFNVGDFMLITDHIKFFSDSPVRGGHISEFGNRFFDMTTTYNIEFQKIARKVAKKLDINLREGVYAFMGGPQFETPAEIKMLRILGSDAVGMSTVPEAIAANQVGMKILGISCISNMAAGITGEEISDDEVVVVAKRVAATFKSLIKDIVGDQLL